jgi:UDP-N-acetylmuramyl pentapeptide phosphotransferase/UDP-N-acetylglucosamine-1-phosphate transferase
LTGIGRLDLGDAAAVAAVVAASGLVSGLATRALIPLLYRRAVLDHPNERSSHVAPTPRGGGIAPVAAVLLAWMALALAGRVAPAIGEVALGTVLLASICWLDDLRGLSPLTRLAAQGAAVAIGLHALPAACPAIHNALQQWLGPAVCYLATALLWMWWINLFNFMDGIDGLAGSEAAAIGGGLLAFAALGRGLDPRSALLAAAVLGAALGFLVWNWSPARVFLGDVGSAPLGYLTGFLLIGAAARGHWMIALILPLYFLADATITLVRRLLRGERVWQAHRQHYYQRAVRAGLGHAVVVRRAIVADLLLIGCGWAAENGWGAVSLIAAAAIVAVLLAGFARARSRHAKACSVGR